MRVLDRLVLRRFAGAYLGFASTVIIVFVFADLFNHVDRFTRVKGRSFLEAVALYYAVVLPEIYYMFAPFIALISAMWVVSSLKRANEMVPLEAAGVRPLRVVAPIVIATAVLAVGMWLDRELVVPRLGEVRRELSKFRLRDSRIPSPVPDANGGVLSARWYKPGFRQLVEARYTRLDENAREVETLIAATADPVDGGWLLRDGVRIRAGDPDEVQRIDGEQGFVLKTDVRPIDVECAIEDLHTLSSAQLRAQIARMPGLRSLEVQLAKRIAYPTASVVLLLLGLPFVLRQDRGAAPLGLLVCIGICALFFVATAFFEDMGSRPGGLRPSLAAWAGNALFGLGGAVAFARARA